LILPAFVVIRANAGTTWIGSIRIPTSHHSSSREPGSEPLFPPERLYDRGRQADHDDAIGISTVDLKTGEIQKVVEGRVGVIVVGRKSRQVYYTKTGQFAAISTPKQQRDRKTSFRSGIASLNADETLLLDRETKTAPPTGSGGRAEQSA
jgi:oligogalacturonide lyase